MTKRRQLFETDGDFLVLRHKQGIRLVEPPLGVAEVKNSISSIYNLPITAYFLDGESRVVNSNVATAELVGAISLKDMVGKTVRSFINDASVERVLATDREILRTELMMVTEEKAVRQDSPSIQALSFKFPWYHDNAVIGLFGCSIHTAALTGGEFAGIMAQLIATGLLGPTQSLPMTLATSLEQSGAALTERESEVLSFVIRGKTAKEIANRLGISRRTVEHHIASIKAKTNSAFKSDLIDKFV